MKSAEIAAKAVLVIGEMFFFHRFENGHEGWRFVGSTPQDSSQPPGLHFLGSGIPIETHLPLAQAATKSAAASGLPPYQAVEPTATAAARWIASGN